MRLDTEASAPLINHDVVANQFPNESSQEASDALRDGVKAAQNGDRAAARTALLRATELDPLSESAWMWLASISEYPEELLVFLGRVLDINPYNGRALEWQSATKSLLSRTFVERGVVAAEGGQADIAAQYFNQALENDQANASAWLWLAKLADTNEGKLSYLEKALEFDPENADALSQYRESKHLINNALLAEARAAAVAGRKSDAHDLLDAFIAENPDSEDGWILRSHLADGFADKIAAFGRVLEINPANVVASSGIASLRAIMDIVSDAPSEAADESVDAMENTASAIEAEREVQSEAVHDKSPTQELEMPAQVHERLAELGAEQSDEEPVAVVDADMSSIIEPAATTSDADWATNTVSFSFGLPGGTAIEEPDTVEACEVHVETVMESEAEFDRIPSPVEVEEGFAVPAPTEEFELQASSSPREHIGPSRVFESFAPASLDDLTSPVASVMDEASHSQSSVNEASDEPVIEEAIPMPIDFSVPVALANTGFETNVVRFDTSVGGSLACPFCNGENAAQAFTCCHCLATLSLSDLEMLLANTHADKTIINEAARSFESQREHRPLSEKELTNLGIAHLNLRNFDLGYAALQEASQANPNNVVLAAQLNSLHIRLDEIRQQEEAAQSMPREKKILVVDDSATVRKLIAGKLEKCGHQVFCAADGVEAIEQLDQVVPDLILLDITMPRMDGYQVCKVIRSKDSTKDVPVVMISGKDGFFDKVRGRMAGTTGYITKPFGPETLMKAVETYLKGEQF